MANVSAAMGKERNTLSPEAANTAVMKGVDHLHVSQDHVLQHVYLYIDGRTTPIVDSIYIESAEMLFSRLIGEIESDVLVSTGNDHSIMDADYLEKREMQRRFKPYLDQFSEYRHLAEI